MFVLKMGKFKNKKIERKNMNGKNAIDRVNRKSICNFFSCFSFFFLADRFFSRRVNKQQISSEIRHVHDSTANKGGQGGLVKQSGNFFDFDYRF